MYTLVQLSSPYYLVAYNTASVIVDTRSPTVSTMDIIVIHGEIVHGVVEADVAADPTVDPTLDAPVATAEPTVVAPVATADPTLDAPVATAEPTVLISSK